MTCRSRSASMGYDAGFDCWPPLTTHDDLQAWSRFLLQVENAFEDDPAVVVEHEPFYCIRFEVGEQPTLPASGFGQYFRRFSSKISGHRSSEAEPYIREVTHLAMQFLPKGRVHRWNELFEVGCKKYSWKEVNEAAEALRTSCNQ